MKIRDGYIKVEGVDGWIVAAVGEESKNNRKMLTLNSTASYIWDELAQGKCDDEIIADMTDTYDITAETAKDALKKVEDILLREGIAQ